MYNRYIPQPDGSYQRQRMQDKHGATVPVHTPSHTQCEPSPPEIPDTPPLPPPGNHRGNRSCRQKQKPPQSQRDDSISGFLRRLLPKDFDTGDLMIVLLLLLMAGDCTDEQNTALLTLALYFFM
ncbi:MAG: hypothetical protein IJ351_02470 [Oscillospiraceae bacterium]|nr:hypothetical protein [Oscillospiraceae bacterium]